MLNGTLNFQGGNLTLVASPYGPVSEAVGNVNVGNCTLRKLLPSRKSVKPSANTRNGTPSG